MEISWGWLGALHGMGQVNQQNKKDTRKPLSASVLQFEALQLPQQTHSSGKSECHPKLLPGFFPVISSPFQL